MSVLAFSILPSIHHLLITQHVFDMRHSAWSPGGALNEPFTEVDAASFTLKPRFSNANHN